MHDSCCVCNQIGVRLYLHRGQVCCLWCLPWEGLSPPEKVILTSLRLAAVRERSRELRRAVGEQREQVRALAREVRPK